MSRRARPYKETSISDVNPTSISITVDNNEPTPTVVRPPPPSLSQRAISQTLASTANLAKLCPSGTLLAFQLLTPIFTNNGACDATTRLLTLILLILLAVSCFVACFTDSFKSREGGVYYGMATFKGMWLFDYPYSNSSSLPDLSKYRLRFIDGVHAVLSVLVFVAVALRDRNILSCFYPTPGHETREVLDRVPVGISLICSLLFMGFPTRRHGIGYPVTPGGDEVSIGYAVTPGGDEARNSGGEEFRNSEVDSITMDMNEQSLTVTGNTDPVGLAKNLRKRCNTEMVSVGPAKEEEKDSKDEHTGFTVEASLIPNLRTSKVMKKAVLKVNFHDDKTKQKAMKAVADLSGVNSVMDMNDQKAGVNSVVDMKDQKLTVTGDIDPAIVVSKLRKFCVTNIISVEAEKKEEATKPEELAQLVNANQAYYTQARPWVVGGPKRVSKMSPYTTRKNAYENMSRTYPQREHLKKFCS